ncbi:SpoIIE family protein phosphatase [Streptomyces yangpuensis]|uniref:SpoIIE family protein phosphatase n=1 Tax=Streptomyces yangpuensis TaxID=1648182 RepID=UPI0036453C12
MHQYLERTPQLPLGLGFHTDAPPEPNHARLQPGERVLLSSDGVTEPRSPDGGLFGEQRLGDAVIRSLAAGDNTPEALRRLVQEVLTHQDRRLSGDAAILLTGWHPS